jgi:hypothetical protein
MTQTSPAATSVRTGDFRLGSVISRSASILWRHVLAFFVVGLIASWPILLQISILTAEPGDELALSDVPWMLLVIILLMVFSTVGQAIVIHAVFQDMRRGPVRLVESLNVALQRFWPLIGLTLAGLLTMVGLALLLVPGLIFATLWFVSLPACIVEQLGPWKSLDRSRELTRGHRWKVFGLVLLLVIGSSVSSLVGPWVTPTSAVVAVVGALMWNGIWTAFTAVTAIVTYHDLRMAKEGIDIEPIAVVFD